MANSLSRNAPLPPIEKAPDHTKSKKLLSKQLAGVVLLMLVVLLVNTDNYWMSRLPYRVLWLMAGGIGLGAIWLLKQTLRLELLSPSIAYSIVFWLFHFGLVFPAAIAPQLVLSKLPAWTKNWLFYEETEQAILMSLIFLVSFVLGSLIVTGREAGSNLLIPAQKAPELIIIGWFVIGIGMAIGLGSLLRFGFTVFLGQYSRFFPIHNYFSWPLIVVAVGLTLQVAGGRRPRSLLLSAFWSYLPLAVALILVGARTAVFFSAVVLATVFQMRGLQPSKKMLFVGALILLTAIAAIKETRQIGVAQAVDQRGDIFALTPLEGMTELGSSLRPVSATINYLRSRDLFYGETYIFPVIRQLERFSGTRREVQIDERFIAARVNQLYGSIGYSTVAEAYINGGKTGVIIFAFVWGLCLGLLVQRAATPYGLAVIGIVLIPMLINVRNSFIFVPAWIILGLLPVLLARGLARRYDVRWRFSEFPGSSS